MKLRFGELNLKEVIVQEMTSSPKFSAGCMKNKSQMENLEFIIWEMI